MTEKQSLPNLLSSLALLERQIDESDEITREQCEEHFSQLKKVDEKVDRLLGFIDVCKRNAALYSERSEMMFNESKRWEKRIKSLEGYAFWLAESFPDIEWRGTDRTFYTKLSPQPKIVENISRKFSANRHLGEEHLADVPQKYREQKTIWILKTDVIKDDLKNGEELTFATLEREKKLFTKLKLLQE
jgi:hypothetical protein